MSIIIKNQEYLTIKEIAEIIGYTPQGIYKKINNQLNPLNTLVKTVKGVKYLPKDSVSLLVSEIGEEGSLNDLNNSLNDLNNESLNLKHEQDEHKKKDITEEIISMLKAELDNKNRQIEELNGRLQEITQALHQEQELNRRQQDINAKNLLMLDSKENKKGFLKQIFSRKKEDIKNN